MSKERDRSEGSFTISLDFELFWGVRANRDLESYQEHLLGVYEAIPKILALFKKYNIHATWATVGFLFHKNIEEIKLNAPQLLPFYDKSEVDPYRYLEGVSNEEKDAIFTKMHCAYSLIEEIQKSPNQEIGTHTYSHFFTYESYKNRDAFYADINHALKIGESKGFSLKSLVFPRNQVEEKSVNMLKKSKIKSYRGNPSHWAYCEGDKPNKSFFLRLYRLIDTYINISGHHTTRATASKELIELKASMMLRPYFRKLAYLEPLKIRRVKKAMKQAGEEGSNFHLWWHPHNFGVNQKENLKNLEELLSYFQKLKSDYNMNSLTMEEVVSHVYTK
jgi:peptidoglycan/xylan/chitin deacetylase (PgdA/CDA1 family)